MDNSRTISSSRPERVSKCLSCFVVTIATVVTVMEKLCSLISRQTFFFFLIMDSKAASPLSAFILVRDIFREHVVTRRSTRGAAKDQGNAGSLWLNGGTVSCFSLRVSNTRNREPPAMTLLPQSWVAAGFELGDMLVERKKKKKKRRLPNNWPRSSTTEQRHTRDDARASAQGAGVQRFWGFCFLNQPIHFLVEREDSSLKLARKWAVGGRDATDRFCLAFEMGGDEGGRGWRRQTPSREADMRKSSKILLHRFSWQSLSCTGEAYECCVRAR